MDEESESSEDLDYEPPEKDDASQSDADSGEDNGSDGDDGSEDDDDDSDQGQQAASSDDAADASDKVANKFASKSTGSRRKTLDAGQKKDDAMSQKSDIRPPKRPLTAYISFTKTQSPKFKGMNFKEVTVLLSTRWKTMSEEEKKPYMEMAAADKKRYEKEMSEFSKSQEGQLYEKMKKDRKLSSKKNKTSLKSITKEKKCAARGDKQKKGSKTGSKKVATAAEEGGGGGIPPQLGEQSEPVDPFQVPIFNQRFLEFNKMREGKLRQLRRACGDVESENAELETHMKALNSMISRSEQDAVRLFAHAQMVSHQLNMLKASTIQRLHSVPAAINSSKALTDLLERESQMEADEFLGELNKIVTSSEVDLSSRQAIKSALKKVTYPKDE